MRSIGNLERAIDKVQSYNNNVDHLINRYASEEGALTSASDILIRAKELAIQASNATMSGEDRKIVAIEVAGLKAELLALANSKDVNGRQCSVVQRHHRIRSLLMQTALCLIRRFATNHDQVGENRQLPKIVVV